MDYYLGNLGTLNVFRDFGPFSYAIRSIECRANQVLKKYTPEQLDAAATELKDAISTIVGEKIEDETERYIERLYSEGGWELRYWEGHDSGHSPSRQDVADLLDNWPSWADDKPDMPSSDEFADLDTLRYALDSDFFYAYDRTPLVTPTEFYAVLALMKINSAAGLLRSGDGDSDNNTGAYPSQNPRKIDDVIKVGNLTIEAMDAIGNAERELSNEQLEASRARQQQVRSEYEDIERTNNEKSLRSAQASALANKRWAPLKEKRKLALIFIAECLTEWDGNPNLYNTQTDFARAMEDKIDTDDNDKPLYAASTIETKLILSIRARQ